MQYHTTTAHDIIKQMDAGTAFEFPGAITGATFVMERKSSFSYRCYRKGKTGRSKSPLFFKMSKALQVIEAGLQRKQIQHESLV